MPKDCTNAISKKVWPKKWVGRAMRNTIPELAEGNYYYYHY